MRCCRTGTSVNGARCGQRSAARTVVEVHRINRVEEAPDSRGRGDSGEFGTKRRSRKLRTVHVDARRGVAEAECAGAGEGEDEQDYETTHHLMLVNAA